MGRHGTPNPREQPAKKVKVTESAPAVRKRHYASGYSKAMRRVRQLEAELATMRPPHSKGLAKACRVGASITENPYLQRDLLEAARVFDCLASRAETNPAPLPAKK